VPDTTKTIPIFSCVTRLWKFK